MPSMASSQHVPFLDLSQQFHGPAVATTPSANREGGMSGGEGVPGSRAKPSFKVTLVGLDKREYTLGERVVFDVQVEALEPIDIPWSAAPVNGSDADQARLSILFTLRLVNAEKITWLQGVGKAFGSRDQPGTLLHLGPGQFARIRSEAYWAIARPEMPADAIIGVDVTQAERTTFTPPTSSVNTVAVRTTTPQRGHQ